MTLYTQLPLVEDVKFPWLFNDSMQIFKSVKKELSNISYDCQFAMSKIGEIHACINVISLWNSVGTPNRNPANYTEIIFLHLKFPWPVANFPDFFHNSKFPWLSSKFPDFSLTSGNPAVCGDASSSETWNWQWAFHWTVTVLSLVIFILKLHLFLFVWFASSSIGLKKSRLVYPAANCWVLSLVSASG